MGVSENSGTPKSSILIGFSIINHPFWGTPIFGNTRVGPCLPRSFHPFLFHPSNELPRMGPMIPPGKGPGCIKPNGDRPFLQKEAIQKDQRDLDFLCTLQGINISHLEKRKIIFKMPFLGDMLVPWRVPILQQPADRR